MSPAVLLVVFNRPDTTKRVFEAIRKVQPQRLYIAADGPRRGREDDIERCRAVRDIVSKVDWPCEFKTLFRDENLGCKYAVSTAVDWFFGQEEMGVILEDDCLPADGFFSFCEAMLERYRDDERVMAISGGNYQFGRSRTRYSYYFSRYNHVWGWASWRRAWSHYDVNISVWPEINSGNWLRDIFGNSDVTAYWKKIFDKVYSGLVNTWDYQWTFACWINSGLTIIPKNNLIQNIGFTSDATHTIEGGVFSRMEIEDIVFPLKHPPFVIRDATADGYTEKMMFSGPLWRRMGARFKRLFMRINFRKYR